MRPRVGAWVLIAATGILAARIVCDSIEAASGEPDWLRWLRTLADHPVRSGIAVILLLFALAPIRPDGASHTLR